MTSTPAPADRIKLLKFLTVFAFGGTERQVGNLAFALNRERFDLRVGCLRRAGQFLAPFEERGVPIDEYPVRRFASTRGGIEELRLVRYIARERIAIVHSYNFYSNVFAVPAAWLAGAPVIIASIRDQGAHSTPRQLFAQRQVCRLADCVLVNAESIRRWLIADGYDPSTIRVIPNGIDTARFAASAPRSTVRADFGIPEGAPIIAMLSRLTPNKGVDDLIDAAALVCERRPDVRVLIVGAGPGSYQPAAQDDPFVAGLKQRVRDLGLSERITFTGYRGDIPSLLREVQVSVLPSLIEGLSNSVLESMAAGCAVVSTNVGGVAEAVVNGESGVLVPPSDVRSLAAAMVHLLDRPDEAKRMGARARQTIFDRYSIDRMVSATERLYTDLLARKSVGRRRLRMPLVLRPSGVTADVHLRSDSRGHIHHD